MNREGTPIPEPVAQLQRQLGQFRSTQPGRTKLPESLWQAAVELARQHRAYPVAHPLRLDYSRLKKRLGGSAAFRRKAAKRRHLLGGTHDAVDLVGGADAGRFPDHFCVPHAISRWYFVP
jgi:hypothetical protein